MDFQLKQMFNYIKLK